MIDMGDDGDIAYRLTHSGSIFLNLFRPIGSAIGFGQIDRFEGRTVGGAKKGTVPHSWPL
jgi:hypothetical protein